VRSFCVVAWKTETQLLTRQTHQSSRVEPVRHSYQLLNAVHQLCEMLGVFPSWHSHDQHQPQPSLLRVLASPLLQHDAQRQPGLGLACVLIVVQALD
jgi:hypothetical protein